MTKPDFWKTNERSNSDPAVSKVDIDVSGGNQTLTQACRAIRCKPVTGVAGVVAFTDLTGTNQTTEIAQGELLPIAATVILNSGTTATGLEALF